MQKNTSYLTLALTFFSLSAHALPYGWFGNVDIGNAWPYITRDFEVPNLVPIAGGFSFDEYTTNSPANAVFAVMAGYKWLHDCWWFPGLAVGVRYQHYDEDSVEGHIKLSALSQFTNYSYSVDISADLVGIYAKLDLFYIDRFLPYLDAGIGAGFTHTNNYIEVAEANVVPRMSPAFTNHTQNNFAYNVGAGLDFLLTRQLIVSVGYDFQYLGPMRTGNGIGPWSGIFFSLDNYKANEVFAGLTYFLQ